MRTSAPTNDNDPAEVFCLAEFLYDEMRARGWTTEDVAVRMLTSRGPARDLLILDVLMCVHKDTLIIDDETFAGMATAFGVSTELFRNLDAAWRKWPDRRSPFVCPEDAFGPISRRALIVTVPENPALDARGSDGSNNSTDDAAPNP